MIALADIRLRKSSKHQKSFKIVIRRSMPMLPASITQKTYSFLINTIFQDAAIFWLEGGVY